MKAKFKDAMSMNEFRRLAAKIDQHMQLLATQGVSEAHAIINRMMGYVPDLHKIWVGTSDQQLMALSHEFPGFYRYATLMEEAFEAERNKVSRPYDGMAKFSEEHKQRAAQLLVTAATLERVYQAFRGNGNHRRLCVRHFDEALEQSHPEAYAELLHIATKNNLNIFMKVENHPPW